MWVILGPVEKEGILVIWLGEGWYLWDGEGNRYFVVVGGMWCTNIGCGFFFFKQKTAYDV